MDDQVAQLQKKGIPAATLHGDRTSREKAAVIAAMDATVGTSLGLRSPRPRLLYVSPELATSPRFEAMLARWSSCIALLAIDEAHC
eukprot:35817-Amphidinium_carterae.1